MKVLYTIILLLCWVSLCNGQQLKFKEKARVAIADKADDEFPVIYIKATDKEELDFNVVYNANGDTLSYQKKEVPNWENYSVLSEVVKDSVDIPKYKLDAEIKPDGKYLRIFFYPFEDSKKYGEVNDFFREHSFAIKLKPRQNLGFGYRRLHAGAMTLPLKIYLGSRADELVNNVSTDANIGIYIGGLFGKKRYLKLPSEEGYRVYDYGWSVNGVLGINKLDINEGTSLNPNSFTGSVVSTSLGASIGWHYKLFTIFTAVGFDIPLSDNADDWVFKGHPWVGFGAGFEIF